ncbi:hypothetical protein niasHT_013730 [Heterodera trifolii]|uniref:Uncharacterized protein n=1 Tax=Heterodera trifolii TaxID=157864 RepID=A0ABD2LBV6_9BILA
MDERQCFFSSSTRLSLLVHPTQQLFCRSSNSGGKTEENGGGGTTRIQTEGRGKWINFFCSRKMANNLEMDQQQQQWTENCVCLCLQLHFLPPPFFPALVLGAFGDNKSEWSSPVGHSPLRRRPTLVPVVGGAVAAAAGPSVSPRQLAAGRVSAGGVDDDHDDGWFLLPSGDSARTMAAPRKGKMKGAANPMRIVVIIVRPLKRSGAHAAQPSVSAAEDHRSLAEEEETTDSGKI